MLDMVHIRKDTEEDVCITPHLSSYKDACSQR
jgi:hypothetical protein